MYELVVELTERWLAFITAAQCPSCWIGCWKELSCTNVYNHSDHMVKFQCDKHERVPFTLNFTALWAYSADDKLMILFSENRIWHFMQIVSIGDNLHEISKPVFCKIKKSISKFRLLKLLPSMLSVKPYAGIWQAILWFLLLLNRRF